MLSVASKSFRLGVVLVVVDCMMIVSESWDPVGPVLYFEGVVQLFVGSDETRQQNIPKPNVLKSHDGR